MKPPVMQAERRVQLFDIANQLHDLAQELDIPIITGSQFNRNGVATIETMQNAGKADIGKNVGTNDVSESFSMLKNFDTNIGIVIEYDSKEDKYYLSFRRLKLRGADSKLDYFLQPFVGTRSKIQLMEDGPLDHPVYRLSLRDEDVAAIQDESSNLNRSVRRKSALDDISFEDDDSINFIDVLSEDIKASEAYRRRFPSDEDTNRDEDGFIVLIPAVGDGLKMHLS